MLIDVPILRFPSGQGLPLPVYATEGSAGCDLMAAVGTAVPLRPGERVLVPTGIGLAIPAGFEAQVRPRSGLAVRHGVTVLNSPGTIDADYRGEIFVPLINHGDELFVVRRGERIAQLVLARVEQARWQEVDSLDKTARGSGGFGSTGR